MVNNVKSTMISNGRPPLSDAAPPLVWISSLPISICLCIKKISTAYPLVLAMGAWLLHVACRTLPRRAPFDTMHPRTTCHSPAASPNAFCPAVHFPNFVSHGHLKTPRPEEEVYACWTVCSRRSPWI